MTLDRKGVEAVVIAGDSTAVLSGEDIEVGEAVKSRVCTERRGVPFVGLGRDGEKLPIVEVLAKIPLSSV